MADLASKVAIQDPAAVNLMSASPASLFDIGYGALAPDADVISRGVIAASTYYSTERFEQERDKVFARTWLYAGRAEDIPAVGDFVVREIDPAGVSAIVVRGIDGKIRAFHDVCLHRGMKITREKCGNVVGFSCPYHAWAYGLDGRLTHLPDAARFSSANPARMSLKAIACETYSGFVFINLDPTPPLDLATFLGGFGDLLSQTTVGSFQHRVSMNAVVEANWKAGLDPQCEGYHVGTVHKRTIGEMAAAWTNRYAEFERIAFAGPHRAGWTPQDLGVASKRARPVQQFVGEAGLQMTSRAGAQTDLPTSQTPAVLTIFPNLTLHPAHGGWFTQEHWPISSDKHRWSATYYFHTPKNAREYFFIEHVMGLNRDSIMEDYLSIPSQQKALESGALSEVFFGESEMLPRHNAAVLEAVLRA
jgi:phenylpropionate dioxygenase-like ring-hydroxylating dioxygenase large terminal subunit